MTIPAPFYLVTFDGMLLDSMGVRRRATGTYERDFDDCGHGSTVRQIIEGQFEHIDRVIEVDARAGTSFDVTAHIALDIANAAAEDDGLRGSARAFVEKHLPMRVLREVDARHPLAAAE